MKIAAMICQGLLGLLFTLQGLNGLLGYAGASFLPQPDLSGKALEYIGILMNSGWLAVVKIFELAGGVLLLASLFAKRFAPLGATLLSPVILNIFLFHALLAPAGLPIAIVILILDVLVLLAYRAHFTPIFEAHRI